MCLPSLKFGTNTSDPLIEWNRKCPAESPLSAFILAFCVAWAAMKPTGQAIRAKSLMTEKFLRPLGSPERILARLILLPSVHSGTAEDVKYPKQCF